MQEHFDTPMQPSTSHAFSSSQSHSPVGDVPTQSGESVLDSEVLYNIVHALLMCGLISTNNLGI